MHTLEWLRSLGANNFSAAKAALALIEFARVDDAATILALLEDLRSGRLPASALTYDALLNCMGDQKSVRFRDAELLVPDRQTLKVLVEELLVCKEYHFTSTCDDPVVIDGGVNFGMAIYISKSLYPNARIIGFEPNPQMYDIARENVRRNGWSNVELHKAALAGQTGRAILHLSSTDVMASSLTDRLSAAGKNASGAAIEVDTVLLSNFITGPVDFLKLDIEGVEEEVLREAASSLPFVKQLFCEVHLDPVTPANRLPNILGILAEVGLDVHISRSPWVDRKFNGNGRGAVGQRYSLSLFAARKASFPD